MFNLHVKECCDWLGSCRLLTASMSDRVVSDRPNTKHKMVRGPRLEMPLKISLANFTYFKLISIKFEIWGFRSDSNVKLSCYSSGGPNFSSQNPSE